MQSALLSVPQAMNTFAQASTTPLVLVVEDEPSIASILSAYLERDGLRYIQVLRQSFVHQDIERRVIPALPPLRELGIAGALWKRLLPASGQ